MFELKKKLNVFLTVLLLTLSLTIPSYADSLATQIPLSSRNVTRSSIATGTNAGATATNSAVASKKHYFQGAVGYTDTTSVITIKDGSTEIYKISIPAGSFEISPNFLLIGTTNTAMSAVISSSTSSCWVNIVTEVY